MDIYKNKVHLFMEMMRNLNLVLAFSLLLTPPAVGQGSAVFASLSLVDYGQRDLLEARRALMLGLVASTPEAESPPTFDDNAQIYLDLAELHLAQMLRPEAAGFLAAVDAAALAPHAQRRHRTLQLALDLMSEGEGLGQAVSRSVGWSQGQALRAAAFARMGANDEAARLLPQAVEALPTLSPAMAAEVLPDLLEAALAAEAWDLAEALAARFVDHTELRDAASYRFLLARASEMSGDLLAAFDGYAQAAQGRDAYAHRARLALARLGRQTDTLPLADAVALLKVARWAWSGDDIAREGATLLAGYALEQGDHQAALWAFALLLAEATTPEQADEVRGRAQAAIGRFYQAGAAGEIDLGAFLDGHANIMAGWRYDNGFVESAVVLPQTLMSAGMTGMAAREFKILRALAETSEDLGHPAADPALIASLRRDEARALLTGGQADAAVDVLLGQPDGPGSDGETERLLIQALSQAGRSDELAVLRVRALDMDLRRSRAVALYETGSWVAAHRALLELWETYPAQFSFSDATRLTLAAYEVGDTETVSRAAAAFPSLSDLPGWAEIAARLQDQEPVSEDLNSDSMRLSMENADRILDAVTRATDVKHSQ
tara:strand:+ start:35854 stop:37671 length:1818 start_codon:yes stop_codon:yes gene_type:complete